MLKFHHLNLCSASTPAMDDFYRKILGLTPVPGLPENRVGLQQYGGHTTYVTDGAAQFHLSEKDHLVGFRTGQAVNPLDRGHIAFRTDDIERFKRHLTELGIMFSDYGAWAMNGWHQVFFYDPAGNVIEVHQDKSQSSTNQRGGVTMETTTVETARAAWTPADLEHDNSWRIKLSDAAARALAARVKSLSGRPLPSIGPQDAHIPELSDAVEAASRELFDRDGKGFAVWSNLPVAGLSEADAEILYCLLGYQLGVPVTQSRAADIVAHVRNEPGVGTQYRGYKSSVRLDFHSDFTHVAALLCLQPAKSGGESAVVSAARAFNVLQETRPDLANALRGDFYLGRVREEAPGETTHLRQPIVALQGGQLSAFYIRKLVDQAQEYPEVPRLTPLQVEALDAFEQVCNRPDVQFKFFMGSGEAFLLNNYRVFHARTGFEDFEDPAKRRHLMRLWIETQDDGQRRDTTPASVRFDYRYGNIGLSPAEVAAGRVRQF